VKQGVTSSRDERRACPFTHPHITIQDWQLSKKSVAQVTRGV
jgi:hypothetical protein